MEGVPGGKTRLLVRQAKLIKVYDAGEAAGAAEPGKTSG